MEVNGATPVVEQTPVVEPKVEAPVVEAPKTEDLVSRASKVKLETKEVKVEEPHFDIREIEQIQDPKAKEIAEKAYKSFQRGFNQKFQELAEIRKSTEAELAKNSTWTKDRIKQIQSDPNFLKAAQEVLAEQKPIDANISDNEWSAMTTTEKQQWHAMQEEIKNLKLQNQQQAILQQFRQQDEQLKTRFSNYDPQAVDIITSDLLAGKVQATREHLWKALDYDDMAKRAYELGKQDALGENKTKLNSASFEGGNMKPAKEIPIPEKGETQQKYFRRLVENNLEQMKQTNR